MFRVGGTQGKHAKNFDLTELSVPLDLYGNLLRIFFFVVNRSFRVCQIPLLRYHIVFVIYNVEYSIQFQV